ncbi:pentatricopeptide repeat-containing protein At2g29760, chloroplastic-like [Aristolochia californica]|uniref:pentatricopeptide repeat-containing protein At2g29760, chloroplastic-like n=1 Tax=Aristolochia californica TaxID=171875 RepID=UPI0035DE047E
MLSTRVETLRSFLPYLQSNLSRYNYLLNSCSSLEHLKQIHSQIVKSGLSQNILLSTKLVSVCCALSSSSMDYAHSMFGTISHPDAFAYNTLIRGYAVAGPCLEALKLYRKMHLVGLMPDNFTFPFVVRSCAVLSLLTEGKQVHCIIIKHGLDSGVFVQSALLTMYAQTGETSCAELVFGEIKTQNVVSWTAMIAGYVQNGFLKESFGVFRQMLVSGTKPNSVTLVSILPACAGLEMLNFGELIHGYGIKAGVDSDVSLVNSLIALYGKCKKVKLARFLFDRMKVRNFVSWNAMIAAYEQNGAGEKAIKLFQRMQTENVKFDYITLVSVISACASLGALRTGRWVHEIVQRRGLETNFSVANALLDMYAKCGCIDLAKSMFDKLHKRNVVSWSAMIGAYAAHGQAEGALKLFYRMQEDGVKPNMFTFTSVLTACRHSGLIEEGIRYFDNLRKDYSIEPGEEHISCLVDLLGRAGRLIEAYKFIEQMPVKPGVGVWGALLVACQTHGNIELAEVVVKHLFQLDPKNVTYYLLMANLYAQAGRWDDVLKLRKLMKMQKLKKIPGHSLLINVVV